MQILVSLDDELLRQAQELTGLQEGSAVLGEALKALIQREASRKLLTLEGTMPELEYARRRPLDGH